jgi:hypothetical protein
MASGGSRWSWADADDLSVTLSKPKITELTAKEVRPPQYSDTHGSARAHWAPLPLATGLPSGGLTTYSTQPFAPATPVSIV